MEINEKVAMAALGLNTSACPNDVSEVDLHTDANRLAKLTEELETSKENHAAKKVMNSLLEKGHFDKAIKGWIEANLMDGDSMDERTADRLTFTPKELYETIYDCIDDITDV